MTRFIVLYVGPPTSPAASHQGWPAWFATLGAKLVDRGSPLAAGSAQRPDGSTDAAAAHVNGDSLIQADDMDDALGLVSDHPYLAQGPEYSVDVHAVP
jgi:hypothetical protein